MRRYYPKLFIESEASQNKARRHNPAREFWLKKNLITLSAGSLDDLYFWRWRDRVQVLSVNSRLEYAGLVEIDVEDGVECGSVFLQNLNDEDAPKDFFDRTPAWQRHYLSQSL
jgi:hypothetical protein